MAQSMPTGTNTFIPQMVQDNLILGFSRNINRFKVNQYVQNVPVTKNAAYYLYVDGAAAVRIANSDLRDMVWPDGTKRPSGDNNVAEFEFKPVATTRYSLEFTLGQMAVEQSVWPIFETNAGFQAVRAMTARTQAVWTALAAADFTTPGNTATASSLSGGFANAGTATDPNFKQIVNGVTQAILASTFGAVGAGDLICLMAPKVAMKISESQEVHSYLKESQFAMAQLRGEAPNQNANWGLPSSLYGVPIVVEDAYKVTSKRKPGTAPTVTPVADENTIYFVSRPNGLMIPYGGVSFSTLQVFLREELALEAYPDAKNRLEAGYVTEDFGAYVVAPASGYKVTSVLS